MRTHAHADALAIEVSRLAWSQKDASPGAFVDDDAVVVEYALAFDMLMWVDSSLRIPRSSRSVCTTRRRRCGWIFCIQLQNAVRLARSRHGLATASAPPPASTQHRVQ